MGRAHSEETIVIENCTHTRNQMFANLRVVRRNFQTEHYWSQEDIIQKTYNRCGWKCSIIWFTKFTTLYNSLWRSLTFTIDEASMEQTGESLLGYFCTGFCWGAVISLFWFIISCFSFESQSNFCDWRKLSWLNFI